MPAARPPEAGEVPDKNLGYWMGKVDAILSDLVLKVSQMTSEVTRDLRDLRAWRETVENRLLSGSARFEDHERRLLELENAKACPLGQECQRAQPPNDDHAEKDQKLHDERFVSWPWLLEKVFVPAFSTLIGLVLGWAFAKVTGAIP
jgi:hypothetical protein